MTIGIINMKANFPKEKFTVPAGCAAGNPMMNVHEKIKSD